MSGLFASTLAACELSAEEAETNAMLLILLAGAWLAALYVAYAHEQFSGTAIGAAIGGTVSLAIFMATRHQSRRQATLGLFAEYYSADFASERRQAARFMTKNKAVDWSRNDPYELGHDDPDLAGYGAVLRFWQRVATLYRENEIHRPLTQRLLSRELGEWNARIFHPMRDRKGMYVLGPVADLAYKFSIGERRDDYRAGAQSALRLRPVEHDDATEELR